MTCDADNLPALVDSNGKPLTEKQSLFLDHLLNSTNGNVQEAMKMAGYDGRTRMVSVILPLQEHIQRIAKALLVSHSIRAVNTVVATMDDPTQPGRKIALDASKEILNRGGLATPTGNDRDNNGGGPSNDRHVIILPPKGASVRIDHDGAVNIRENDDDNMKIVEHTADSGGLPPGCGGNNE